MIAEINAAVQQIASLIRCETTDRRGSIDAFTADLSTRLQARFHSCWFAEDGERGSAWRSLSWQAQAGGEGLDRDISASLTKAFHGAKAINLIPQSFTMWVDPACVAIRMGSGPGLASLGPTSVNAAIKTIYSTQPAKAIPHSNVSAALSLAAPYSASNFEAGPMTRSTSLGASSISASEYADSCPSLSGVSSRSSSSSSSVCSDTEESDLASSACSEASAEDIVDRELFANVDFIDEEDELELDAALRRRAMQSFVTFDKTICADDDDDYSDEEGDETVQAIPRSASKINMKSASYDGGNVGVLGGGVRLGDTAAHSGQSWPPRMQALWPENKAKTNANPWSQPADLKMHGAMQSESQYVVINGVPILASTAPTKRSRTRGRRSRGRGAGRAARRQAAAAQRALEQMQCAAPIANGSEVHNLYNLEGKTPSADGGALGLTVTHVSPASPEDNARIMSIVRQRAEQVQRDVARRQLERQTVSQMQRSGSGNLNVAMMPRTSANRVQSRLQHQRSQPHLMATAQLPYPPVPPMSLMGMPNYNHGHVQYPTQHLRQHSNGAHLMPQPMPYRSVSQHHHSASLPSLPPLPALHAMY